MNNRHALLAIATGNVLVALLAGFWGYTSYMYNWLNVGGGVGDVNFWSSMREAIPHIAVIAWIALIAGAMAFRKRVGSTPHAQLLIGAVSIAGGPIVLVLSDWCFHIGFPHALM